MSLPSVTMSPRTYPIRNVQLATGLNLTQPRLRVGVAFGSQEDPRHQRRADKEAPRELETVAPRPALGAPGVPLTTEALAAHGDSLEHLRRRVAVSLTRSVCPASSSTSVEEHDDLKRRMDQYMLHRDYHQSLRGEDGEEPIDAIGSPPQTDMDWYYYSGPPTDVADAASLPRRSRFTVPLCEEPTWRLEPPTATRTPEACQAYEYPYPTVRGSRTPGPADGALNCTAELLAKLLSGALSEAVRAKLGITEPLAKPAMASPSAGLTSLADDVKRARVSRLLPKVTCPKSLSPSFPNSSHR